MPSTSALLLASIGYIIGALQLISAHWIKEEESTHPAYKLEKAVWGAVFIGSATATLLTEDLRIPFRIFTSTAIVITTILAFIFIRYRRTNPLYRVIRLRTQRGVTISGTMAENNAVLSKAAALIRHHRAGGGQALVSEWAMEEMRDALTIEATSEQQTRLRGQLNARRERKALEALESGKDVV